MLLIFCWAPTNWQSSNLGKMNELSKFLRFNQLFLMDLMMSTISKTKLNFFVDCMGIVFWVTLFQLDRSSHRRDPSYKGGRAVGSIDNPDDPHTTVFSMMVSSLSTKFSSIVRLIPLGSSSAETLYPIVKSTICDYEAVCTDNYPPNVRLYKRFSANSKV